MTGRKPLRDTPIPEEFLDGLEIGVFLAEPHSGRIVFVNKRAVALLGYTSADVIARGLTIQELTHPDDREASAAEQARLLSGEISHYALDKRYLRQNGDSIWADITATLIRDDRGEPQWCAVAIGEMPERRILELQLAAAKELAGMLTWSWAVKPDQVTTSGSSIFGVAKKPLTSFHKMLLKVHPDDRRAVEATVARAVASGSGYSHEYRAINREGEIRYMRGMATCVLDEAGEVTHLVGATIDITDIKVRQGIDQAPKTIRDIFKYIEANWNKPIYLNDLARQHGISPRAIQRYFAARGMMPLTKHIKQLRLRHAHRALSEPKPRTSVTGVALYCGFQNPGHFSRDYRKEFGELPSETLRNALRSPELE